MAVGASPHPEPLTRTSPLHNTLVLFSGPTRDTMALFDRTTWAALSILRRHLGLWTALRVGINVERRVKAGDPFKALPPATDDKERGSREQLGPALVLFEVLCGRVSSDTARTITAEVVEIGAHIFLRQSIGTLDLAHLSTLDEAERRAYVEARMARFPNADARIDFVEPDRVGFTVTSCRFVRLCREVGLPDLAPIFCAGDASYFGGIEPDVQLIRPQTLAAGGSCCPFELRYDDASAP